MFAAVPPFVSTVKFVYSRRWDLLRFFLRFPRLFLAEVWYLVTGIELDPLVRGKHLPLSSSSLLTLQEESVQFPKVFHCR
jgi:hypothetical protein